MQVEKLMLRPMGSYHDIPVRPWHTVLDHTGLNAMMEATSGGRTISSSSLSGVAGSILRPSAEVDGVAAIANGWGEQRMLFVMHALVRTSPRAVTREIITGYTDYVGYSEATGRVNIDEGMCLYFNSVVEVTQVLSTDRAGNSGWNSLIRKSNQILAQQLRPDFTLARGVQGTLTMRPEDVFMRQTTISDFATNAADEGFYDMRAGFNRGKMKFSRRDNSTATRFLDRTLRAQMQALTGEGGTENFFDDRDPNEVLMKARGTVREDLITIDPIFQELSSDTNVMADGFITYGELLRFTPDLDHITQIITPGAAQRTTMDKRNFSSHWGGSDNESIAATILAQAIPTYLLEFELGEIGFIATNDIPGGQMNMVVNHATPFYEGPYLDTILPNLITRLTTELLPDALPFPDSIMTVEISCAVFGDTMVRISFDRAEPVDFIFPSFCDAAASMVITQSSDRLDVLASDINTIALKMQECSSPHGDDSPATYTGEDGSGRFI